MQWIIVLLLLHTLFLLVIILQRRIPTSILKEIKKQMSELSDAVAAIANDVTELQGAVQRVLELLNQPDPDVASAVAALQNADAAFDALRDSLNAAGNPPTAEGGGGE